MIRVHLLTEPPTNQNTTAFLSPLLWNEPRLRARGIQLRVFIHDAAALAECDIVILNSKFWSGPWDTARAGALGILDRLRTARRRVYYFDRTSTPGTVNAEVLPFVDGYLKNAAYRDRTQYQRQVYGGRLFSEYYRDKEGVTDAEAPYTPPRLSADEAARIGISWNTGLANYSMLGPRLGSLYRLLPSRLLFVPPRRFTPPQARRTTAVSCRMGLSYKYATVGHQRRRVAELLQAHRRTQRVSKFAYVREMRDSQVVVSPFGYSEINYKDFETFLAGAALLKPDMSHLETWPDYFRPGETFVAHRWDLSDLAERVNDLVEHRDKAIAVAAAGQALHRWHVCSAAGQEAFADRFAAILGVN